MVLVFSSVFMGIWNSDQKAMHSAIARNKRLNKPIAVFPMPPVETVRRENLAPLEFSVPEPRPVRVAMRSNDEVGQGEPVIERHEEQTPSLPDSELPVVTLKTVSDDVPEPQIESFGAESVPGEDLAETVADGPVAAEPVIPELAPSESEVETAVAPEVVSPADSLAEEVISSEEASISAESSIAVEFADDEPAVTLAEEPVLNDTDNSQSEPAEMPATEVPVAEVVASETSVGETGAQIEEDSVPAPEDFSIEVETDANVSEVVESATPVATVLPVMVADSSTEETVKDQAADVSVEGEQPRVEAIESELPEPAEPVVEESAVPSDAVAMNDAESTPAESKAGEANEEEKSLEDKLLKSGEYDMLDVHSEDVTPGTVEPALDDGATCIPLPRNLASGTWQIIHPSGEFFKITVDRGESSNVNRGGDDEETLETSFCITTSPDGVRWCFIRSFVDSPAPVRRVTTEFFSPGQQ